MFEKDSEFTIKPNEFPSIPLNPPAFQRTVANAGLAESTY